MYVNTFSSRLYLLINIYSITDVLMMYLNNVLLEHVLCISSVVSVN